MGTRGSFGVIYQEKEKLSYNHFDSYPSGLGAGVLDIIIKINNENGWDKLKENMSKLKEIKEKLITDEKILERYKKYSDISVSEQKLEDPYCLFRKIQGEDWIKEVYNGELEHYIFNNNFIKDSLFCEYAYIINLDTMMLEFYNGFQKVEQKYNRFGEEANEDGYYPCRLVGIFNLLDINDSELVNKMNQIIESEKDDPSVISYIRKNKLENIEKV
jgi:hypothetical protein